MDLQSVVGDIGRYTRDSILVTTTEATEAPSGPAIVWCNQAFTDMTGYRLEDIHGQTPRLLQGPDTPRKPLDRVRRALQAWQPVRTVVKNYTRAGAAFWAELSIVPVADETGWYRYWVAVQRDVTDRVRQELHLKARYRKLQESELALQQEKLQISWHGAAAHRRPAGASSWWTGGPRGGSGAQGGCPPPAAAGGGVSPREYFRQDDGTERCAGGDPRGSGLGARGWGRTVRARGSGSAGARPGEL